MSVPKQRQSKSRRDRRRRHHKMESQKTVKCSQCQKPRLPHIACPNCGYYKGKEVVNTLKKTKDKIKK